MAASCFYWMSKMVLFILIIWCICSVEKQYEEERLQRLVQEEAVKFLWKEVSIFLTCNSTYLGKYR